MHREDKRAKMRSNNSNFALTLHPTSTKMIKCKVTFHMEEYLLRVALLRHGSMRKAVKVAMLVEGGRCGRLTTLVSKVKDRKKIDHIIYLLSELSIHIRKPTGYEPPQPDDGFTI